MSKNKLTISVLQTNPLVISIKKNGRSVHSRIAMDFLMKNYNGKQFILIKGDHAIIAREQ